MPSKMLPRPAKIRVEHLKAVNLFTVFSFFCAKMFMNWNWMGCIGGTKSGAEGLSFGESISFDEKGFSFGFCNFDFFGLIGLSISG